MKRGLLLALLTVLGISIAPARVAAQTPTYTDLHDFSCQVVDPNAQTSTGMCNPTWPGILAQGTDGNLYGMACDYFTPCNYGSIFKMTPSGAITVLFKFDGIANAGLTGSGFGISGLTLGPDGNFYGVTPWGGSGGCGTIFQVTPSGAVKTLYVFDAGNANPSPDGCNPVAPPVIGDDGYLYGTAANVGYKISTTGDFRVLTTSLPYLNSNPVQGTLFPLFLASDGNFYGTVPQAGANGGLGSAGTVYRMSSDGTVTILHNFFDPSGQYTEGFSPYGGLVEGADGNLYGTTFPSVTCCGTVFQMTKEGSLGWVFTFPSQIDLTSGLPVAGTDGGDPYAGLIAASDGNFYGAASIGGDGYGTFFNINNTGSLSVLYTFEAYSNNCATGGFNCGIYPYSQPMQATSGFVYGMAQYGGYEVNNNLGTGVFYGLDAHLTPFVATIQPSGKPGDTIGILGEGFSNTSSVSFNGIGAVFNVISDTYLTATVPAGATTGPLTVIESGSTLSSNHNFRILESNSSPAATSTSLASSVNPSTYGQSVTFTATVTSQSGTPTGSIMFSDGNTTLGSGVLSSGQATITTSALTAGSHSITAAYGGDSAYSSSNSTAFTQTVKTTTSISVANIPSNAVFGGSFTPAFSYTGDGVPSVTSSTITTCTVSGNVVNFMGAGTCTLAARATAGTNYAAVTGNPQSFTIAQLQPSIGIANIPAAALYGGSFTPTYVYAGDGSTSVSSSTASICTVSGAVVNFVGVGACTLTAHATPTANSTAATGSPQSFSVAKATPSISINNLPVNPAFGGSFTPTYAYSGIGKTSSTSNTTSTCTVSGKGVVSFVGVGPCSLTAHATATTNYAAAIGPTQSFTISKATTTISIKNIPSNPKHGGSFTPSYNYIGDGTPSTTSSTPSSCTVSGNVVNFIAAGSCTLTAQATAGVNYAATTGNPQTFTVK